MNTSETKKYMRDLVAVYYGDGHVFLAGQKAPRPVTPYITVKYGKSNRKRSRITLYDEKDQCQKNYWQRRIEMEINLYTQGKNVAPEGYDEQYENTAVDDLEDFVNFLYSDEIIDRTTKQNVVVSHSSEVTDLSSLQNESTYRYRAIVRLTVDFTDCTYGDYGQNAMKVIPNSSNGGTADMVAAPSFIEQITIKGGLTK